MIYLDTSVIVAYYCPEEMSDRAESIVRGRSSCFISDLTEVEFFSAIARKVRQRELTVKHAAGVRHHFINHLTVGVYRRVALGSHHVLLAKEFISGFETALRTLDALHLALVSVDNLQLVTADEGFARSAKALSIPARLLK